MRSSLILGMCTMVAAQAAAREAQRYWVFIGTGTTGTSESRGIYRAEWDCATGHLSQPILAAELRNPTFLALHPNGKLLYSVAEAATPDRGSSGRVVAFAVNPATGELKPLNEADSGGRGPCHVSVDPTGQCVLVANYGSGTVKCIRLQADGTLGSASSIATHEGKGPNIKRQEAPHPHAVNLSPDGRFAIVTDLGIDRLLVYRLNIAEAQLTPHDPKAVELAPGSGPRHFAWHPAGKLAFVNGELDATVTSLAYDPELGRFQIIATAPTLPEHTTDAVRQSNTTAEVVVHSSGRHVFVSNRGRDSIAVLSVSPDGKLKFHSHISEGIRTPRNFALDPTGRWLLAANQDGNDIAIFQWNEATATHRAIKPTIGVPKPMCIKLLPRD